MDAHDETVEKVDAFILNANDTVRVKLTDAGRAALKKAHEERFEGKLEYHAPKEDADGYSRWQVWSLMADIGSQIYLGMSEPLFENWDISIASHAALGDGWRDIASAPKEEVLLFFPRVVSGAHRQNVLPAMYRVGRVSDTPNRKPTHWMLLPNPPAETPTER